MRGAAWPLAGWKRRPGDPWAELSCVSSHPAGPVRKSHWHTLNQESPPQRRWHSSKNGPFLLLLYLLSWNFHMEAKEFYFAFPGGMEPLGVVSIPEEALCSRASPPLPPSLPCLALGLGLACWGLSSAWTEHFGSGPSGTILAPQPSWKEGSRHSPLSDLRINRKSSLQISAWSPHS